MAAESQGSVPLVSVGLPIYNGERYLRDCLDSIMVQTYPTMEVIISDNGSTDGTASLCEEYVRRDPRIRYLKSPENRGAAWNHNRVLQEARGTYFKWCGADDGAAPGFVAACVAALEARPDAVLAYPLTTVIDDVGEVLQRTTDRLPLESPDPLERFRALLSSWAHTHNPFYGVMRRDQLLKVRPLGSYLASDRALLAELALRGPFLQVEEYLMIRRDHAAHRERTREKEQQLLDPAAPPGFAGREWTMLREHLRTALRMEGPLGPRLRVAGAVGGWAYRQRVALAGEAREFAGYMVHRWRPRRPTPAS